MNVTMRFALAAAGLVLAAQAAAQVTFYEREGFEGRAFTTKKRSTPSIATASTTAPRRWSSRAMTGGRSATTPSSRAGARSCVPAGIRRWPRWA